MRQSLIKRCVISLLLFLCLLASGETYGFESPDAIHIKANHSVRVSNTMDIKKQSLTVASKLSTQKFLPNLEALITQLQRSAELRLISRKLMPWIYLNSTESMVADFETTVVQLEIADANLQSAMYEAFVNNNLIGMSPKIKNATDNLDIAEFTLRILLEILDAKL